MVASVDAACKRWDISYYCKPNSSAVSAENLGSNNLNQCDIEVRIFTRLASNPVINHSHHSQSSKCPDHNKSWTIRVSREFAYLSNTADLQIYEVNMTASFRNMCTVYDWATTVSILERIQARWLDGDIMTHVLDSALQPYHFTQFSNPSGRTPCTRLWYYYFVWQRTWIHIPESEAGHLVRVWRDNFIISGLVRFENSYSSLLWWL
jgi:hypothetical protein